MQTPCNEHELIVTSRTGSATERPDRTKVAVPLVLAVSPHWRKTTSRPTAHVQNVGERIQYVPRTWDIPVGVHAATLFSQARRIVCNAPSRASALQPGRFRPGARWAMTSQLAAAEGPRGRTALSMRLHGRAVIITGATLLHAGVLYMFTVGLGTSTMCCAA